MNESLLAKSIREMCLIKLLRESQCIIKAKCLGQRSVSHMMKFHLQKITPAGLWRMNERGQNDGRDTN